MPFLSLPSQLTCPLDRPQLDSSALASQTAPEIRPAAMTFQLATLLTYFVSPTSIGTFWVLLKCHSFALRKPMSSFSSPASSPMQDDHYSSHSFSPDPTAFVPVTSFSYTGTEEVDIAPAAFPSFWSHSPQRILPILGVNMGVWHYYYYHDHDHDHHHHHHIRNIICILLSHNLNSSDSIVLPLLVRNT